MAERPNNPPLIILSLALLFTIMISSQEANSTTEAQEVEPDIPEAVCIYEEYEYSLTPHILNDGEKSSRVAFPHLPDNYEPEMTMKQGGELEMQFDSDKQPTEIQALLVDYESDVTETYPLEKINDSTFKVTQTGIKTLEVIGTFADNEHISYTMLIDVEAEE